MTDEELNLPPEFAESNKLSIPEVAIILKRIKKEFEDSARDRGIYKIESTRASALLDKSLDYATRFNKFSDCDVITKIRQTLENFDLSDTEIALLTNLCPNSTEEAKSLIPSLYRYENNRELRLIIEEINQLRNA
jgi:DNA-directed RNA polymerase II subunit RPB4